VAEISVHKGAPAIKSENARKDAWVYADITGVDVGTYVKRAQKEVAEKLELPPGYSIVWSGQYEYMIRAQQKLMVVVSATLIIIFLLLYLNFQNITESLIVMLSVPFALTGGLWLMDYMGYNMSVAVAVGFIALCSLIIGGSATAMDSKSHDMAKADEHATMDAAKAAPMDHS
jgi:Cu(I)/Ag(I) efflux system membrane protein CusA/SilA